MNGQGRWGSSPIPFDRLEEMFGDWVRTMRENRPPGSVWAQATRQDSAPAPDDVAEETPARYDVITVDEYRDGDVHVVRAALPGVDPDRDVEITADDGVLRIAVERHGEDDGRDYLRREMHSGRSSRTLPLPERARPADIAATYRDGILEIRIPLAEPPASERTRVTVTRG